MKKIKVAIASTFDISYIESKLDHYGFVIDNKKPDIVISYGGDGTVLFSERKYPSIQKLAIKTSKVCRKSDYISKELDEILERISKHKYKIKKEPKLIGQYKRYKLHALNEIQIRNKIPTRAIRFEVSISDQPYQETIGDGIIITTPFGSSGYSKSAGGRKFKKGIGLCLNNPFISPMKKFSLLPDDSVIKLKLIREKAVVAFDNSDRIHGLKPGDIITIKKSKDYANFIQLKHF